MADTFTPRLNLVLPEIGASRSTWGTKLNANTQAIDAYLYARMPPGALQDFAGPTVPDGWLPCDGRAVSRTEYSALYSAIGNFWGAGDGSTTFNVPDLRGRGTVGAGSTTDDVGQARGYSLAQRFGQFATKLLQSHLPQFAVGLGGGHSHTAGSDAQGSHSHGGFTDTFGDHAHQLPGTNVANVLGGGGGGAILPGGTTSNYSSYGAGAHSHWLYIDAAGSHTHNISVGAAPDHQHMLNGGDAAHENTHPIAGVTKMIFTGKVTVSSTTLAVSAAARDLDLGHAG